MKHAGVIVLIFASFIGSNLASTLTISEYKYIGYKNVWHEGTYHISLEIGNSSSLSDDILRNACANECTLDLNCDAFFVEDKSSGNCHLVDEQGDHPLNRTIGHGWKKDNIYYVKKLLVPSVPVIPMDPLLMPPCDQDYEMMSAADCASLPAQAVTYNRCPYPINGYQDSVSVRSDLPCDGEDRLLQCELDGGQVVSDVVVNTKALFDPGLLRTTVDDKGAVTDFTFVRFVFEGGPRIVTRMIVRNANVYEERLAEADIVLTAPDGTSFTQSISFSNDTNNGAQGSECAALIMFEHSGSNVYESVQHVELRPVSWFGGGPGGKPMGFKADIFVKPIESSSARKKRAAYDNNPRE